MNYSHSRNAARHARMREMLNPSPFGAALYAIRVRQAQERLRAFTTPILDLGHFPRKRESMLLQRQAE